MSAPPYMKLYVADYLGDTHHLGALEHGAYLLLLMAMWRAGGSLPAADANLAKLARCTPDQWAEVRLTVLPYFKRSRGRLTHKRLASEMAKYETVSGKRSEAAQSRATKKGRNSRDLGSAKAEETNSNCTHNQNQNQSSSEDKSSGPQADLSGHQPTGPVANALDPNAEAWRLGVGVLVAQGRMTEKSARTFFGGLLKGIKAEDLMPAIGQAIVSKTQDPQGYLSAAAHRLKGRVSPAREEKRVSFV